MKRQAFPFTTQEDWLKLRAEDITSTEIAALFGISPYLTNFELWHQKKNKELGQFEPTERMKWGTRLQESIAKGIAEDNGWDIRPFKDYIRIDGHIGSSFDYGIEGYGKDVFLLDSNAGILEIKNVDALAFKDGWLLDGDNIEAPTHIELQVQHQLLVCGRSFAYIGALVGGNRVVLLNREADKAIHEKIIKAVAEFWKSIEDGKEPEPDFKRDAEFISKLYNKADKDSVVYADQDVSDLANLYKHAQAAEKVAKTQKDEYKAKILTKIGLASKVMSDAFTISSGLIKETVIPETVRAGYRQFKITFKKGDGIND